MTDRKLPTPPVPAFVEWLLEQHISACGCVHDDECEAGLGARADALAFLRAVLRECRDTDTDWVGRKWAELHAWAGAEADEEESR